MCLDGWKVLTRTIAATKLTQPGAILAPHFASYPRIIYILHGKARVEITYNDGESALKTDVKKGDVIVFPSLHPTAVVSQNI